MEITLLPFDFDDKLYVHGQAAIELEVKIPCKKSSKTQLIFYIGFHFISSDYIDLLIFFF